MIPLNMSKSKIHKRLPINEFSGVQEDPSDKFINPKIS